MPRNTQIDKKTLKKEVTQWILVAPGTSFTCIVKTTTEKTSYGIGDRLQLDDCSN